MAILFSQADGSDQHYDTYEEFEQAFILIKRLNGEKVPQDLLDEAKTKFGDKEAKSIKVEIDGTTIVEKMREVQEGLEDKLDDWVEEHGRVEFISDDKLDEESYEDESAIEVGDKVRVISAEDGTGTPFHGFEIGSIVTVTDLLSSGRIDATDGDFSQVLFREHCENIEDTIESPTEFRNGDIVIATEDVVGFGGNYYTYNAGELLEVQTGGSGAICLVKDSWKGAYVSENLANIELVCRREDRKDIEL